MEKPIFDYSTQFLIGGKESVGFQKGRGIGQTRLMGVIRPILTTGALPPLRRLAAASGPTCIGDEQLIARLHEICDRLKRQVHQVIAGRDARMDSVPQFPSYFCLRVLVA